MGDAAVSEAVAIRHGFRVSIYDAVRALLGVLLLVTAAFKAHQIASDPIQDSGLFGSRWILIGIVEAELLLGLWLLSRILPTWSWAVTIGWFGILATVSLVKVIRGEHSCGCFGKLDVSPWMTFSLDVAALAALVRWRPIDVRRQSAGASRLFIQRPALVVLVWLLIGIPVAVPMITYQAATLSETGDIIGNDKVVVLNPRAWIGQQFAIAQHIDIGDKLQRGLWVVLFFQRGCQSCEEAVSKYREISVEFQKRLGSPKIALIECPPYSHEPEPVEEGLEYGSLDDSRTWRMQTPIAMLVDGGSVQAVFDDPRNTDLLKSIWAPRASTVRRD